MPGQQSHRLRPGLSWGDDVTGLLAGQDAIEGFEGTTLRPGEPAYDEARRVFNGMVDRRPALIARCSSVADVAAVVRHAVGAGVPLTVYGGGHWSVPAFLDSDLGRDLVDVSVS
jgi:hypothetical protein